MNPPASPTPPARRERRRRAARRLALLWRRDRTAARLLRWGLLLVVAVLVLRSPGLRPPVLAVWVAFNVVLLLVALGWGLFHLVAMWRAQGTALRWSFAAAAVGVLAAAGPTERALSDIGIARISVLAHLVQFLTYAALLFPVSFAGASLGALVRPRVDSPEAAANRGVVGWWLALAALGAGYAPIWQSLAAGEGDFPIIAYFASWPSLAVLAFRMLSNPGTDPQQLARRLVNWMSRRLVPQVRLRGRAVRLDLRGAVLGLSAAVLAVAASGAGLLQPARSGLLGQLLQIRGVFEVAGLPEAFGAGMSTGDEIVLLDLDAAAQQMARSEESESVLQARVIAKLAAWGARAVVVTPPFTGRAPVSARQRGIAGLPPPTAGDGERAQRDLPRLAAGMAEAGNVYLAVHSDELGQGRLGALEIAARASGSAELARYGGRLPAVRFDQPERPPLAAQLAALLLGQPPTYLADAGGDRFAGQPLLTIEPATVLVDYAGAGPGARFAHAGYTTVLRNEPVARVTLGEAAGTTVTIAGEPSTVRTGVTAVEWVPAAEFFRDKLVILDRVAPRWIETPAGLLTSGELLAHAVETLRRGGAVGAVPRRWSLALTALVALLVGQLSLRRDPLNAAWRLAVTGLALVVVSLAQLLFFGRWLDPVEPLLAALIAAMLVVQVTLLLERSERERNRALLQRFVAPQVVDELLEDPEGRLGLGGTRQQVCVLFADVRGFTPFSEQHTPEEVVEVMNAYMTGLTIALHQHGGLLDKYTGDGLMALFRIGDDPPADLLRAVAAGLEMRAAAETISSELAREGRQPLQIGLGMHYGEAVVGLIGNPNQFNYTALGYTVAVAQRLESLAEGGEFLISDTLHRVVADQVVAAAGSPVRVKGVSEPIRPYSVTGLAPARCDDEVKTEPDAIDLPL